MDRVDVCGDDGGLIRDPPPLCAANSEITIIGLDALAPYLDFKCGSQEVRKVWWEWKEIEGGRLSRCVYKTEGSGHTSMLTARPYCSQSFHIEFLGPSERPSRIAGESGEILPSLQGPKCLLVASSLGSFGVQNWKPSWPWGLHSHCRKQNLV